MNMNFSNGTMSISTKVYEAGFGDDSEAYEASWRRTFEYAQSGAIDDLLENNA